MVPIGVNPFLRQEGGTHYSKLPIQPILFATANQYDPAAFSILKYLTRFKDKDGIKDLKKAFHFVELRQSLLAEGHTGSLIPPGKMSMTTYIRENEIGLRVARALTLLNNWVYGISEDGNEDAEMLKAVINDLITFET